jgi:hypothetical protein
MIYACWVMDDECLMVRGSLYICTFVVRLLMLPFCCIVHFMMLGLVFLCAMQVWASLIFFGVSLLWVRDSKGKIPFLR